MAAIAPRTRKITTSPTSTCDGAATGKKNAGKQPTGRWCWECEGVADHLPQTKDALNDQLKKPNSELKVRWVEEHLPTQRRKVAIMIATGNLRISRQTRRSVHAQHSAESSVKVPGTWLQEKVYKVRFVNAADRKHKWAVIMNPETGLKTKAYFVPDAQSGVWRGEHGFVDRVTDDALLCSTSNDVDVEDVGEYVQEYMFTAPKVTGKSLAQLDAEAFYWQQLSFQINQHL